MLVFLAMSALICAVSGVPVSSPLPSPRIALEDVIFTLYTRTNGDGERLIVGDSKGLAASSFNGSNPVKIATHGFMADGTSRSIQWPRKAFLTLADMNVIGVDWNACSRNLQYEITILCATDMGAHMATLIKYLRAETGMSFSQVHLLGHSLGGQVVSYVNDNLEGEKVGRLTAWDPAGPMFNHEDSAHRVDPEDADFVDVIHTYVVLGVLNPGGHVDFYPNGGINQPGCSFIDTDCSHKAAISYFIHTIPEENRDMYMATQCDNVEDARAGNCTGPLAPLGYDANLIPHGIYYINMTAIMDNVEEPEWP